MSTIIIPQIYLPAVDDLGAWATIACDQYTSDGAYWQKLESFVGDKPSTLNLIFPEIYVGIGLVYVVVYRRRKIIVIYAVYVKLRKRI